MSLRCHSMFRMPAFPFRCHELNCHSEEERLPPATSLPAAGREFAFRFYVVILRRSFSAPKNLAVTLAVVRGGWPRRTLSVSRADSYSQFRRSTFEPER